MKKLYIVGAGGLGKETFYIINKSCTLLSRGLHLEAYIDEDKNKKGTTLYGVDIRDFSEMEEDSRYIVAMGDVEPRIKISNYIKNNFKNVAPYSIYSDQLCGWNYEIGDGTLIFPDVTLTADVTVGDFCVIYQNCSVNHDSNVGNYTTLCPNVNIAANSKIGNNCYLGIGSTVSNKVNICDGVRLGANTCVVKDITEPGLYVGTPARKIK